MKALFDASALLNIIRAYGANPLQYLRGSYVLTLIPYEIGDALWKEATLVKNLTIGEAITLLNMILKLFTCLNIVSPKNSMVVLRLAHELMLTYYDSSYIVSAALLNAPLITDDVKLMEEAKLHKSKIKEILQRGVTVYSSDEYFIRGMNHRSSKTHSRKLILHKRSIQPFYMDTILLEGSDSPSRSLSHEQLLRATAQEPQSKGSPTGLKQHLINPQDLTPKQQSNSQLT